MKRGKLTSVLGVSNNFLEYTPNDYEVLEDGSILYNQNDVMSQQKLSQLEKTSYKVFDLYTRQYKKSRLDEVLNLSIT